jgi:hypothetical protein
MRAAGTFCLVLEVLWKFIPPYALDEELGFPFSSVL